tara:strand:+ start:2141 stop:3502 length:1362 start_codon:yes stop_codon:yes gene_type:complete
MAYIGQRPTTGENNSFKVLDDITSYTLTFDGSSSTVVSAANDTITHNSHRFVNGQKITYSNGGGTNISGLNDGNSYYIIKDDNNHIKLADTYSDALAGSARNITGLGAGLSHTINVAFDNFNTKFKVTYENGTLARLHRSAQLQVSINGVIQQGHDSASPATGYGIDFNSVIVFSTAPASTDVFWGNLLANNLPTFDITDNKVDNFTGNGSTVDFNLSKPALNNENILVTIDGVTQYPSDAQNTRAYNVVDTTLTFSAAPPANSAIQVRHIGFAGATVGGGGGVTGFYGRTGNASLQSTDDIAVRNVNSSGVITATSFEGSFVGSSQIGIQSGGVQIGAGITQLNFIGIGNTIVVDGSTVDISIQSGAGGTWHGYSAGIATVKSIGINTSTLDDTDLTGIGNSFKGLYIANGMVIHDNTLNGNHYIGTNFSGMMAGPVSITGVLSIDGNYVVV